MQIREHEGVKGKRDFYPFNPRLLKVDEKYNVRDLDAPDERADLDELKEQIRESGVRVPLEVRLVDQDVFITAGHRRHKAVMELISEGVEIETVPVIHEPKYINDAERDLGLIISNSGKPLSQLQRAAVVRRLMAHGWDEKQIAAKTGIAIANINNLVKVEALPEAVKEQVKQGDISPTLAVSVVKNLPAGTDPAHAAKLIADMKAENKRFGVGAKNNHRVTPKTINRNKPKLPAQISGFGSEPASQAVPLPVVPVQLDSQTQAAAGKLDDFYNGKSVLDVQLEDPQTWSNVGPETTTPPPLRPNTKELIEALEPFANLAQEENFDERGDHDLIEVPFRHLKRAWVVFAKVVGGCDA